MSVRIATAAAKDMLSAGLTPNRRPCIRRVATTPTAIPAAQPMPTMSSPSRITRRTISDRVAPTDADLLTPLRHGVGHRGIHAEARKQEAITANTARSTPIIYVTHDEAEVNSIADRVLRLGR